MTGTATAEFMVVEDAGDYFWLKELEGPGKGLQVAVPRRHEEYNPALRERIDALEPGQFLTVTLRSTNEKNTAWRFEQLPDSSVDAQGQSDDRGAVTEAPADD